MKITKELRAQARLAAPNSNLHMYKVANHNLINRVGAPCSSAKRISSAQFWRVLAAHIRAEMVLLYVRIGKDVNGLVGWNI